MDFRTFLQENIVLLDGGTGTLLQEVGLPVGELPERWNLSNADVLTRIHKEYFDAGSNVVCANTFGANVLKFSQQDLEETVAAAIANAKNAAIQSLGKQEKFVALDLGPTGKLLKPFGTLAFEEAVEIFAKTVRLGVKYGADLILVETMSDAYETKAALLAVKESCNLPVLVSCAFGSDGKLMTGASPEAMIALLESMGADGVGANCSLGPKQLAPVVEKMLEKASVPVLVKANAGLPKTDGKRTYYDVLADEFAADTAGFVEKGARVVGGCCGTTPAYIAALAALLKDKKPLPLTKKNITCVSSYTHAVEMEKPVLVGERINPTGKKRFKQALLDGEIEYAIGEALAQQERGAHILDVNVGLPGIDEEKTLKEYVESLQAAVDLPLQIDTSNLRALESALRVYNGKPLVNSVNGKEESMQSVFPLVKKYGGVVVALTLDENGIPDTWQGRVKIAEKIVKKAAEYGIEKKDILIDALAMSVATDKNAANVTLKTLEYVSKEMGLHTTLGVSNVSFGLPAREQVNAVFLARALQCGLSAAIVNPLSVETLKTYYAFCALSGKDENCAGYIRFALETLPALEKETPSNIAETKSVSALGDSQQGESSLCLAIVHGRKERAMEACRGALETVPPLEIVHQEIVPALDKVGKGYEEKRVYLPQLLMSAEAAKGAFEVIKEFFLQTGERQAKKCMFVIATVQGDIHDIGKNIVKTLLENYGFDVLDLGKDVPSEKVVEAVVATRAPMVGLSALMTTTLPAMEETLARLKERAPWCKTVVGGAVLNKDYAEKMGADFYAKDGMETVRFAENVYAELCKKR